MINPLSARSEGNPSQSIEEIYKAQFKTVYRVCYSYMMNEADTEEIVSEVFLKLLKNGLDFRSAEHEKAWLLRAAINMCKDHLKHWWRKREDIESHPELQSGDPFRRDEILDIVMKLPERFKDVIFLYYYEGYTTEEAAGILKKPHATVRYHLREARKLLREVLEENEE